MRPHPSDTELLAAIGTDRAAFELFYRRHVSRVLRFAARRCATPEDLADVVAQTFLEAIGAAERFDGRRGDPLAWLLGIAAHCAAAAHRRNVRETATARRLSGRALLADDDYERLEDRLDAARLGPGLAAALASLSDGERDVVELVDVDGLAPAQAAQMLGIRPAAARMRLARARRSLRRALADARATPAPAAAAAVQEDEETCLT